MAKGRGQPTKYRKDFHPNDFIALSKKGKTFAQIALIWDVDRDSLKEWAKKHPEFSAAVKKGRQFAEGWYIDIGQAALLGQVKIDGKPVKVELGWFVWMTKNMFQWRDKIEVKEKEIKPRPYKDVSDEELDKM